MSLQNDDRLIQQRPPLPPFTEESARIKVQAAEDAWNTRDPVRVAQDMENNGSKVSGVRRLGFARRSRVKMTE